MPANDPHGCNAALVKYKSTDTTDNTIAMSRLDIIDETSFNEVKKGLTAGATFVISGVPIGANTTWNDFQLARTTKHQENNFASNYDVSHQTVLSYVSPDALKQWGACMAQASGGFTCDLASVSATAIQVRMDWSPPHGVNPTAYVASSTLRGATPPASTPAGHALPDKMPIPPSTSYVTYDRTPGQDFDLAVNLDTGYGAALHVDATDIGAKPVPKVHQIRINVQGSSWAVVFDDAQIVVAPPAGGEFGFNINPATPDKVNAFRCSNSVTGRVHGSVDGVTGGAAQSSYDLQVTTTAKSLKGRVTCFIGSAASGRFEMSVNGGAPFAIPGGQSYGNVADVYDVGGNVVDPALWFNLPLL